MARVREPVPVLNFLQYGKPYPLAISFRTRFSFFLYWNLRVRVRVRVGVRFMVRVRVRVKVRVTVRVRFMVRHEYGFPYGRK